LEGRSTAGSVCPDAVSADKRSASFEVKNYDINTNADALINNVARQVQERARHLPRGMQQNIRIDVRGQNVSSGHLDDIARRIVEKSNGLLRREHIRFVEPYC
jgi:filamentous hemagglutinin